MTAVAAMAALPLLALPGAPARAEVTASEVLTWCDGASQPGQLGAINAFRCVNYLQGAADMVQALGRADLGACLGGGQSAGAQLMARFVPSLRGRPGNDIDAVPVATHVADWLAQECGVALAFADGPVPAPVPADIVARAATPPEGEPQPSAAATDPATAEALRAAEARIAELEAALAETQGDAAAATGQLVDMQAALELAMTMRADDQAACSADRDALNAAVAAAEAEAVDSGMRVSELELELEAVDAEAIARRQEIAAAETRVAMLTDELDAAVAERDEALADLTEAKRDATALAAIVDEARTAADAAREAADAAATRGDLADERAAQAESRLAELEQRAADAEARANILQATLANAQDARDRLQADLQTLTATTADQNGRIASLADELQSCQSTVASVDIPRVQPPAFTPARAGPPPVVVPTPPSVVTSPRNSTIVQGPQTNAVPLPSPSQPRPLDALGLQALRQTQQQALHQAGVGQRRPWTSPDGRYEGYVEVLQEGYAGPDYCREIYSLARSGGSIVHQSADLYCQAGNLWVFRPFGG
ncbi:MAG: hypothetical protein R3F55_00110 [Alphaproteobacteria bacterium]